MVKVNNIIPEFKGLVANTFFVKITLVIIVLSFYYRFAFISWME